MEQLELAETVEALRAELARAAAAGAGAGFQFPVTGGQLEFHVGVTKTGEGKVGVKFYVVELGGSASPVAAGGLSGSGPAACRSTRRRAGSG